MLGFDIVALTSLAQLLFNGLAILVIFILYIRGSKKRQKEYENERAAREEDYKKAQLAREEEYKNLNQNYNKIVYDIVNGITHHHLTPAESKSIAQVEKQINDIIKTILNDTNASRVCVVKYHNGNKDMTGMSFLKMSMTNEVINIGVAPLMTDFQNHFRSLLAYWCHEIDTQGYCVIADTEDLKNVDITMYEYLKSRHVQSKYGRALRDVNGDVIGFLCVEYLDKNEFDYEKIKKSLKNNYQRIETLIGLNGGVAYELQ